MTVLCEVNECDMHCLALVRPFLGLSSEMGSGGGLEGREVPGEGLGG